MEDRLQEWCQEATEEEKRAEAAEKIKLCYAERWMDLSLTYQKLSSLPRVLDCFHDVKQLDLSHNQLQEFILRRGAFRNLRNLDLSHNELEEFTGPISNLQGLERLKIGHNKMRELPVMLGSLQLLNELDISNNDLERLPDSVVELSHRCTIWAQGNRFSPQYIEELRSRSNRFFLGSNS